MSVTSPIKRYAPCRRKGQIRHSALALAVTSSIWATACSPTPPLSDAVHPSPDTPSRATWAAEPDRLEHELPTALQRAEWAILRRSQTPASLIDAHPKASGRVAWQISALHPDGRTALIHAWSASANTVTVTVRVGSFGDADEERHLIESVKQTLARPRPTIRQKNFSLPDAP